MYSLLYCVGDSMYSKDAAESELIYPTTGSIIGLEQWASLGALFPVAVTDSGLQLKTYLTLLPAHLCLPHPQCIEHQELSLKPRQNTTTWHKKLPERE